MVRAAITTLLVAIVCLTTPSASPVSTTAQAPGASAPSLVAISTANAAGGEGGVLFVDDDAPAAGDGLTWDTAYRFLQDALAFASDPANGITEIRVAQGTYKPDRDEANPGGTGDREATFQLVNGVTLAGGYAGIGAEDPDAWDIELYRSILSGDLAGNDKRDFVNYEENSYHICEVTGDNPETILQGFTVQGGNATDDRSRGGALLMEPGTIFVSDCLFLSNQALSGGAVYIEESSPTFQRCSFANNQTMPSGSGGAVYCRNGASESPTFVACLFEKNLATFGGAVLAFNFISPVFNECLFSGNTSVSYRGAGAGGALLVTGNNTARLINCVLADNTAPQGGAIFHSVGAELELHNCTVARNHALDGQGGGVWFSGETVCLNSVFWGNTATEAESVEDEQLHSVDQNELELNFSCVEGLTGDLEGIGNIGDDPAFADPDGRDGVPGTGDEDYHLTDGSPCVDAGDPDFEPEDPFDFDGDERIRECRVDIGFDETPFFADCDANGSSDACDLADGLVPDCNSNLIPDECDLPDADCDRNGEVDECEAVQHYVFESPQLSPIGDGSPQSYTFKGLPLAVETTTIRFAARGDLGDFDQRITVFLNGNPLNNAIFKSSEDCEDDTDSDFLNADFFNLHASTGVMEFTFVATENVDTKACPDSFIQVMLEYDGASALDCDANGVLDQCEPSDCNDNGIADQCEIMLGLGEDCNDNAVPDDCDVAIQDCNNNGLPDDCDILTPFSASTGDFGAVCLGASYTLKSPPLAAGPVRLFATGHGDYDTGLNKVELDINGSFHGFYFANNGNECGLTSYDVMTLSADQWNSKIAGGQDAVFTVSPWLDKIQCCGGSTINIDIDYLISSENDANGDGIPDECETLLGDIDGDGDVDAADLILLLGAWGACADCDNCPADLDGDCDVDGADLILLLGNWG